MVEEIKECVDWSFGEELSDDFRSCDAFLLVYSPRINWRGSQGPRWLNRSRSTKKLWKIRTGRWSRWHQSSTCTRYGAAPLQVLMKEDAWMRVFSCSNTVYDCSLPQAQVSEYKFEMERLAHELQDIKKKWVARNILFHVCHLFYIFLAIEISFYMYSLHFYLPSFLVFCFLHSTLFSLMHIFNPVSL